MGPGSEQVLVNSTELMNDSFLLSLLITDITSSHYKAVVFKMGARAYKQAVFSLLKAILNSK